MWAVSVFVDQTGTLLMMEIFRQAHTDQPINYL